MEARLRIYCVWFCQKVLFTNVRYYSSSGAALGFGSISNFSSDQFVCRIDELSLHLRREKLSLQYATRLAANPSNPAFTVTFSPQFLEIYECKSKPIRPFGLCVLPLLESSKINPKNIEKQFITDIPSWSIRKRNILFDLLTNKKSVSTSHIMKQNFQILQSRYRSYQHIYNDGSRWRESWICLYIWKP